MGGGAGSVGSEGPSLVDDDGDESSSFCSSIICGKVFTHAKRSSCDENLRPSSQLTPAGQVG